MRILIVGYGRMGQRRARACLALGHTLTVVEPNESRRPGVPGVRVFGRVKDAPACDAVFICTPADTHASAVQWWALNPGPPYLAIEKPLGVERGPYIPELPSDARACVAYSWRFHPVVRDFRAAIAASGDLRVLRFTCFAPKRLWSSPPKLGQLWPECSHEVDLSLWLTNSAADISEQLSTSIQPDTIVASWQSLSEPPVETHGFWSIDDTYPANRRIFEAITSTERIVMAADGIDESVYDEETATILRWFEGVEDDRICTLAQAQRVLEVVA